MGSWASVTVGVADLDSALALWEELFGMTLSARRDGSDPALEKAWGLAPGRIEHQVLLATPGQRHGRIHLVQFDGPDAPVRHGAQVFDLCPKNLDVYVEDMPLRLSELRAAGQAFRNTDYSEVTAPNGVRFREIHMPAHDEINVVLLEVMGYELPFSSSGYAAVGPLITIVADAAAEKAFYRDVLGLSILSDNILDGPEIERMVGLPPGAALDVSIWGQSGEHLGQVEIIEYRGTSGANLYPLARPGALGILHASWTVGDLDELIKVLTMRDIVYQPRGVVESLLGRNRVISFQTPAGFRIEAHQPVP